MNQDMKKIFSFMVAALALAAVSCNKEVSPVETPVGETVVFSAEMDATKTTLNGNKSEWVAGDKITIHNGTKGYEFSTAEAGAKVDFTYTGDDFAGTKFMAAYPAAIEADVEAKTVKANIPTYQPSVDNSYDPAAAVAVAYTENASLAFKNATSLIKFTVKGNNVKGLIFYGNNGEAVSGDVVVTLDAENAVKSVVGQETTITENEVTETKLITWAKLWANTDNWCFKEGTTYYLAVAPQNFEKGFSFELEIDGVGNKVVKTVDTEKELKPNTIYNIGELEYVAPVLPDQKWGVVGTFTNGWDIAKNIAMTAISEKWYKLEGVELYKDDLFKFVKDNSWDGSLGAKAVFAADVDVECNLDGDQNLKVTKNGVFNIYLNPFDKKFKVECVEEYTDLMVNITIDNKANWSPLTISLWEGDNQIVTNAAVTDNVYSISADYIGASLTCQFSNGSKESAKMSVSVTRTGATVTLEETIIKLKVTLDTANSKQWWGNTMKIHVWETGTSFDTSWPGNTMTSEGNYTWSIIVPSELVGKTIKYLVHNGGGWQSNDATVTIQSGGNSVTGSSIGIN